MHLYVSLAGTLLITMGSNLGQRLREAALGIRGAKQTLSRKQHMKRFDLSLHFKDSARYHQRDRGITERAHADRCRASSVGMCTTTSRSKDVSGRWNAKAAIYIYIHGPAGFDASHFHLEPGEPRGKGE